MPSDILYLLKYILVFYPELTPLYSLAHYGASVYLVYTLNMNHIPYFLAHKIHFFFPEKCDLNSTCVLCAEGKYYFQTYKYSYIYYTTSLS